MSLSKKARFEVFKRDKFTCCYCGRRPPEVVLQVDHVVPKCEGGGDEPHNLTTACFECNAGKSGTPLEAVLPVLDESEALAAIQEMAERRLRLEASIEAARAAEEAENRAMDVILGWWNEELESTPMLERDTPSVRRFIQRLDIQYIREAIQATRAALPYTESHNKRFRYFCKCCWNMIREAESA